MSLDQTRREYRRDALTEAAVDPDPLRQFQRWYDEAAADAGTAEPNAMALATADGHGRPSVRMVLLKGVSNGCLTFYTNYLSRKGRELQHNPHAALLFFWPSLERQVRIEGVTARLSPEESNAYFQSRPFGSRIGSLASMQSEVIASREALEARMRALEEEYTDRQVPLPPSWGGYALTPEVIEFWQGRENRLHDRLRYTRKPENRWLIERLSP